MQPSAILQRAFPVFQNAHCLRYTVDPHPVGDRGWLLMVYRTGSRSTEFTFHFVADHYDHLTDTRRQIRGEAKSLRIAQAAVIAAVDGAEEAKSI